MPRGDGTGPRGLGSMTGRGAGYCAGTDAPGYGNPAAGRGFGMGFGRGGGFGGGGRGWRNRFFATGLPGWVRGGFAATLPKPDVEAEKAALKFQADALQAELDSIRKRLEKIEAAPAPEGANR
jgi:hypothetical protein